MVQYVMRKMTLKKRLFPLKKIYVEKHICSWEVRAWEERSSCGELGRLIASSIWKKNMHFCVHMFSVLFLLTVKCLRIAYTYNCLQLFSPSIAYMYGNLHNVLVCVHNCTPIILFDVKRVQQVRNEWAFFVHFVSTSRFLFHPTWLILIAALSVITTKPLLNQQLLRLVQESIL